METLSWRDIWVVLAGLSGILIGWETDKDLEEIGRIYIDGRNLREVTKDPI